MELGFSRVQIKQALELLRYAPFTTTVVEQLHGSGAVVMKGHQEYGEASLRVRQAVHQCRRLIDVCPMDAKLAKLRGQLEELEMAQAPRIHGRHAFLRHVCHDQLIDGGIGDLRGGGRSAVRAHGALFAELSGREQARFAERDWAEPGWSRSTRGGICCRARFI